MLGDNLVPSIGHIYVCGKGIEEAVSVGGLGVGGSGLVWLVLDRFLCCVYGLSDQTVGACPLGYVVPGWIWTGVQWCTSEV